MANYHKRQSIIRIMKINGVWSTLNGTLRRAIVSAFQDLLSNPGDWRASTDGLLFSRINKTVAQSLEAPFSMNEVHFTLCKMNGDKAPRPNGFTIAFWQFSWDIVKDDVTRKFRDFHNTRKFVRSLNSTFLVLIPKKGGAKDFKDFRSISLVGSLDKLLEKVLANRLKRVMYSVVKKAQNAFVGGRHILDASLIANEVIDTMVKKKERGILCKLDIEKAYDWINWNFLLDVLQKMGFGRKWIT